MIKLLSAGFSRLWKYKLFWAAMVFMAGFGLVIIYTQYENGKKLGFEIGIDSLAFAYTAIIGIVMAVLISMFTGVDYSDGTIRNKLIVGNSRLSIYISNLIVNIVVAVLLCGVFVAAALGLGIPLLGSFHRDISFVLQMFAGTIALAVAFTSIYTFVTMVCSSRTVSAVLCIMGFVVMFIISMYISNALNAPEYYEMVKYGDTAMSTQVYRDKEDGEEPQDENVDGLEIETVPNPQYITGTKRKVYETINKILPTSQSNLYSSMMSDESATVGELVFYDLIIIALTTVAGMIIFKKKDIK